MIWWCTKESIPCKYETIGCGEMVRENELSEHELECKEQHLQLAMDTVLELVQQVRSLQDEVKHTVSCMSHCSNTNICTLYFK